MKRFFPWLFVILPAFGFFIFALKAGLAAGINPKAEVLDLIAESILLIILLVWIRTASILKRRQKTYWIFVSGAACLIWLMVIKMVAEYSIEEPFSLQLLETLLAISGVILLSMGIGAWSHDYRLLIQTAEEKQQQYRQLSYTDALTGIGNRAAYDRQLKELNDYNTPYVLLLADIDHFKKINDQHGHDVGDLALQHVAKTIHKNSRGVEECFRIGGEEFALLLANCTASQATDIAERIRYAVETTPLSSKSLELSFTISIGLCISDREETSQTTYRHADTALYQAKKEGRNQVVFAD